MNDQADATGQAVAIPEPPFDLIEGGQEHWDRLAPQLAAEGMLALFGDFYLWNLCNWLALAGDLEKALAEAENDEQRQAIEAQLGEVKEKAREWASEFNLGLYE